MVISKKNNLYLVLTSDYAKGRDVFNIAESAVMGGVDILQLREKNLPADEISALGKRLRSLCSDNNVIFIVNDDPYLAKNLNADGVHLGQEDLKRFPIRTVRQILGTDKIVGLSTHDLKQFEQALSGGFDYLAYGPIFHTKTKDYHIGPDRVKDVLSLSKAAGIPVVFIGGINIGNIGQLMALGAENIALIRAIMQADDIVKTTTDIKNTLLRKI